MAGLFQTSMTLPPLEQADLPAAMNDVLCPGDRPLALLPVRLETRFFADPAGGQELRIRIYPDKLHLYSHETGLTSDEQTWGGHYWEQDWRAGNNEEQRSAAWRQLQGRFGDERARYVARALTPLNPGDRPQAPVAGDAALSPAPQFPDLAILEGEDDVSWRSAPQARMLPDRWIAVVHSEGRPQLTGMSRDVRVPLAVGPDPRARDDDVIAGTGVDSGMEWMVDFAVAEEAGMALRLKITQDLLDKGLDSLFVFGVSSLDPVAQSAGIAELIDGHGHTDGFAFLPLGMPTNRTEEDAAGKPRAAASVPLGDSARRLGATTNSARLGWALGIKSGVTREVLGWADRGRLEHADDCRSMNAVFWPIGWGYFLSNMLGFEASGLKPEDLDWAQDHFLSFVDAPGAFAPFRCGRQPYGLLPVTSLDLWQPPPGQEAAQARENWLKDFLVKLRETVWRPKLPDMPRLGRQDPPDPDADLNWIMSHDAVAATYAIRSAVGRQYFEHLRAFAGEDLRATGFMAEQDRIGTAFAQSLDLPTRTRMAEVLFAELPWPIKAPLVQADDGSPARKLAPNYIAALLDTSLTDLVEQIPGQGTVPAPQSLLEALVRHALLREVAGAAAAILAEEPGADRAALLRDAELVGLVDGQSDSGWRQQLDRKVAAVTGSKTILQYLDGLDQFDAPAVRRLGDLRQSLKHLKELDDDTLQWLLQGTLDLGMNRLDAWVSSLAGKRLQELREGSADGIYVGAFGWVENLVPEAPRQEVIVRPPDEDAPLYAVPADPGFIHAPSATHASAAALLRNAHLGATGIRPEDSPFAINLSSRRIREAQHLLEGARMGQPLGALLGYRLERSLHELSLDYLIAPLREEAPISAGRLEGTASAVEAIAANNVVDGLTLNSIWKSNAARIQARLAAAGASAADAGKVGIEIEALGHSIDGLSDALTAEVAYQMARGNIVRSAATISSIAGGDVPPPELEVAKIPRTGTAVSHRMLVLVGPADAAEGWATTRARAKAEPVLESWVSRQLGDARRIMCTVERLDDTTGAVAESRTIPLSDLEISALDFLYAIKVPSAGQPAAPDKPIEDAILALSREGSGGFAAGARLRLVSDRPAGAASDRITLQGAIGQARAIRSLLSAARGAGPEDLNPPHRTSAGRIDLTDLKKRADKADSDYRSAVTGLEAVADESATPTPSALRKAIGAMAQFGVGSRPNGRDETADSLRLAARATLAGARSRLTVLDGVAPIDAQATEAVQAKRHIERLKAAFGSDFVVLPRFKLAAAEGEELGRAMDASDIVQGGDGLPARDWFFRYGRVRDPLARLSMIVQLKEALSGAPLLDLKVAQLPYAENERWVALPPEDGQPMAHGKLSLVVQGDEGVDPTSMLAGLMVDEWTEVVPSAQETTAVTFQYNPPDSCAPQSVLLAVPPRPGEDWSIRTLHRVLVETLDLAKLRTIDAQSLYPASQYLPATYMAFNVKGEAVSTDLSPLTR
jgi:hypothetical protein